MRGFKLLRVSRGLARFLVEFLSSVLEFTDHSKGFTLSKFRPTTEGKGEVLTELNAVHVFILQVEEREGRVSRGVVA